VLYQDLMMKLIVNLVLLLVKFNVGTTHAFRTSEDTEPALKAL
jgi:hypothetical protein